MIKVKSGKKIHAVDRPNVYGFHFSGSPAAPPRSSATSSSPPADISSEADALFAVASDGAFATGAATPAAGAATEFAAVVASSLAFFSASIFAAACCSAKTSPRVRVGSRVMRGVVGPDFRAEVSRFLPFFKFFFAWGAGAFLVVAAGARRKVIADFRLVAVAANSFSSACAFTHT